MNDTKTCSDRRLRDRLNRTAIYVLTDGARDLSRFLARIAALADAEVGAIQLRDKRLSKIELRQRGQAAIELIESHSARPLFIVNDSVELAAELNADGVHLGQDDADPTDARSTLGADKLIGVSTHNLQQASAAVSAGADYLGAGPTFPSNTKSFDQFPGLAFLRQVAAIEKPIFAIGGISAENLDQVLQTGIRRVAVSDAIVGAEDIHKASHAFHEKLKRVQPSSSSL